MTFYPITRNHSIAPTLVVTSLVVALLQTLFGPAGNLGALWSNVGLSALIAACLWDMNSRYHFVGSHGNYAFMMGMVLLPAALNLPLLHLTSMVTPALDGGPQGLLPSWMMGVAEVALVALLFLAFSAWQQRSASVLYLCVGALLGGLTLLHAHFLYWVVLIPVILYHTRSFAWRNWWSALTGVVLGGWIVYFLTFLVDEPTADTLWQRLPEQLVAFDSLEITHYALWPLVYMAGFSIPVLILSLTGFLPGVGDSIRTRDSLSLISSFSIFFLVLALFDGALLPVYVALIAVTLTLQLSIRQGMLQSVANEWWNFLYLLFLLLLGAVPLLIEPIRKLIAYLN
jgi:hypothetical protein